jgi:acetyl esterase/lipase
MDALATRELIRTLGRDVTSELEAGSRQLFADSDEVPDIRIIPDQHYGVDYRQRLDLIMPGVGGRERTVLIFVPCEGMAAGARAGHSRLWDNVGRWAALSGFICVTIGYRPAPEHSSLAGAEDVAAAVAWVSLNIEGYGGRPDAMFLMGHAAGAGLVANYIAHPALRLSAASSLAGALMISGPYASADIAPDRGMKIALRADCEREAMHLLALASIHLPMLFTVAEFDPLVIQQQAHMLAGQFLAERQQLPQLLYLTDHNQLTSLLQLGAGTDTLGAALAEFMADHAHPDD